MATLTVTVPDPQVPRVQAAIGASLGLEGDATAEQVRQVLVDFLKAQVRTMEARQAALTAANAVVDIDAV